MSDAEKAYQATPASTLEEQIMNPCIAKNEREWWAAAEIERLSEANTQVWADNERLRAALRAARVAVEDWASYASDFYREKWDLQGDLAHIEAALAEEKQDD